MKVYIKHGHKLFCSLIPNINLFNNNLIEFNSILDAEEIILFEKLHFSDIINSINTTAKQKKNQLIMIKIHKLKNWILNDLKISNIIKTYKQSITKLRTNFKI